MDKELKKYLLEQCREWMLPEELNALRRLSLTENGEIMTKKAALLEQKMEKLYGFNNKKINTLVALGEKKLDETIMIRLLNENQNILNKCAKCGGLARTPKARQCRHCGHKWFGSLKTKNE